MRKNEKWLYFNIHGLVGIRLIAGHTSEHSMRLAFGPFETRSLDSVDLTLRYDAPEFGEHSFGSELYLFTNDHIYFKNYKLHLVREEDGLTLASKRDLLPFLLSVIQWLLLKKQHSLVHGAAVAIDGRGVLIPGWGGTGKTSAIVCLLKQVKNSCFLSDDISILSADGRVLSFPKAFFIYPYHRSLFPHLFNARHKLLVPMFLSGVLEQIRTVVRPAIMSFPRLEKLARRITPEHMQIPARKALPDATFSDSAPLDSVLFVERSSGTESRLDEVTESKAKKLIVGNWNYEQGRCARDLLLGAGGTAFLDLEAYYSRMSGVLDEALDRRKIFRLRMGSLTPAQTGKTVVDTVCQITSREPDCTSSGTP